jgi:hypothetical protein
MDSHLKDRRTLLRFILSKFKTLVSMPPQIDVLFDDDLDEIDVDAVVELLEANVRVDLSRTVKRSDTPKESKRGFNAAEVLRLEHHEFSLLSYELLVRVLGPREREHELLREVRVRLGVSPKLNNYVMSFVVSRTDEGPSADAKLAALPDLGDDFDLILSARLDCFDGAAEHFISWHQRRVKFIAFCFSELAVALPDNFTSSRHESKAKLLEALNYAAFVCLQNLQMIADAFEHGQPFHFAADVYFRAVSLLRESSLALSSDASIASLRWPLLAAARMYQALIATTLAIEDAEDADPSAADDPSDDALPLFRRDAQAVLDFLAPVRRVLSVDAVTHSLLYATSVFFALRRAQERNWASAVVGAVNEAKALLLQRSKPKRREILWRPHVLKELSRLVIELESALCQFRFDYSPSRIDAFCAAVDVAASIIAVRILLSGGTDDAAIATAVGDFGVQFLRRSMYDVYQRETAQIERPLAPDDVPRLCEALDVELDTQFGCGCTPLKSLNQMDDVSISNACSHYVPALEPIIPRAREIVLEELFRQFSSEIVPALKCIETFSAELQKALTSVATLVRTHSVPPSLCDVKKLFALVEEVVSDWLAQTQSRADLFLERLVGQETFEPVALDVGKGHSAVAVDVAQMLTALVDNFAPLVAVASDALLREVDQIVASFSLRYANMTNMQLGAAPITPAPKVIHKVRMPGIMKQLTKTKRDDENPWGSAAEERRLKAMDPRQLLVRISNCEYLKAALEGYVAKLNGREGVAWPGIRSCAVAFDEAARAAMDFLGAKTVFVDLHDVLIVGLYRPTVRSARLLPLLDKNVDGRFRAIFDFFEGAVAARVAGYLAKWLMIGLERVLMDGGDRVFSSDDDVR